MANQTRGHLARQSTYPSAIQTPSCLPTKIDQLGEDQTASTPQAILAADGQHTIVGFGPKQSRNLLQALGLTRFEIPIDSRVTDWLNDEFNFPVRLSATALAGRNYYDFVSAGIQTLCERCRVYPCIFDAAVFALKDGDSWTNENAIF